MIVGNNPYLNNLEINLKNNNFFEDFNMKQLLKTPVKKNNNKKQFYRTPSSNKFNNIKFILNSNNEKTKRDSSTESDQSNSLKINLLDKLNSVKNESNLQNLIDSAKEYKNYFRNNEKKLKINNFIYNSENQEKVFLKKLEKFLNFN